MLWAIETPQRQQSHAFLTGNAIAPEFDSGGLVQDISLRENSS
ncbi:hypothetical protein [Coleofasciculus sp. FACHB-1120]|nr:hypothetical protein [Coleofasciculus sp. FACHB-1120]